MGSAEPSAPAPPDPERPSRRRSAFSAAGLVVASMVGTGVYTTSGFLLEHLSPLAALIVWAVGGLVALAGALAYAELGVRHPHQGGEYALLFHGLHPAAGFMAGAVSVVIGFGAPIAGCALAFAHYVGAVVPGAEHPLVAVAVVWLATGLQLGGATLGDRTQDALVVVSIALVVALAAVGLPAVDLARLAPGPDLLGELFSPAAGLGVVIVSFAYSGWNAATYVAGEVRDPRRSLPFALLGGTLVVTLLYVALNTVLLASAPRAELSGQVEIAFVAARALFGAEAASVLSIVVALGLLSTTGALVMTGARVAWAMGADFPRLGPLGRLSSRGAPAVALVAQAVLATVLCLFADIETILTLVGMTLSLVTAATVVAALRARLRDPAGALPASLAAGVVYLVLVGATVVSGAVESPVAAAASVGVVVASGLGYLVVSRKTR